MEKTNNGGLPDWVKAMGLLAGVNGSRVVCHSPYMMASGGQEEPLNVDTLSGIFSLSFRPKMVALAVERVQF